MTRRLRWAVRLCLAAASLGTLLLRPAPARACSCVGLTPAEAFQIADAMFVGKADSVRYVGLAVSLLPPMRHMPGYEYPDSPVQADFEVETAWKGLTEDRVTVHTGLGSGDCGAPFKQGDDYVVFTYLKDGRHFANVCLGAAPAAPAAQSLAYLQTHEPLPVRQVSTGWSQQTIAAAGAMAAVVVALCGLAWRSLRRREARR